MIENSPSAPPAALSDRELLFGIIAVQLNFLPPLELARAVVDCLTGADLDLPSVLAERCGLTAAQREVIERALLLYGAAASRAEAAPSVNTIQDSAPVPARGAMPASKEITAPLPVTRTIPGRPTAEELSAPESPEHLQSFGGEASVPLPSLDGVFGEDHLKDYRRLPVTEPDRYKIKKEAGRGAIGTVMIAYDDHMHREVALKELLPERAGSLSMPSQSVPRTSPQTLSRFLREARITARLDHPGIVPVYEIAKKRDGQVYYTMKLVRGRTLADKLAECRGSRDRLRLLNHFLDLSQAMAYAHSKGVIHRDLKPANVMVGEFGETIILDWGLAKVRGLEDIRAHDLEENLQSIKEAGGSFETIVGAPIGTPAYMSPEQAEGQVAEIDERSDVWGLGAFLYEILTGEPPFSGGSAWDVVGKVLKDPVRPVAELEPQAPPELRAIAEKCLAKDPAGRYPNAGEVAADLDRFMSGGMVSAYEYSMTMMVRRWLTKHRAVVASLTAGVVLVTALGMWSVDRIRRERNVAVDNRKVAEAQRVIAEDREAEALANLKDSLLILGRWAVSRRAFGTARIYYAKAVAISDGPETRYSYNFAQYSPRLNATFQRLLEGHTDTVMSVAVSPDGKLAASGSRDRTVKLWDPATGEMKRSLHAGRDWITTVAFSPDGLTLASGGADGEVKLWKALTGELVRTFSGRGVYIREILFISSSNLLASACEDGRIEVWDLAGSLIATLTGHTDAVRSLAVSRDGRTLVSGSADQTIKIWDLAAGSMVRTLTGHQAPVNSLDLSPDGKTLASGSGDNTVKLWDPATGRLIRSLEKHQGWVWSARYSPRGDYLVSSGEDMTVKLWDPENGELLLSLEGHNDWVPSAVVGPEGKFVASGCGDKTIKIWQVEFSEVVTSNYPFSGPVLALVAGNDNEPLAAAAVGGTVEFWAPKLGLSPWSLTKTAAPVTSAAFSPDRKFIAAGLNNGAITIWDAAHVQQLLSIEAGPSRPIEKIVFTPDGRKVIAASEALVTVSDAVSGERLLTLETGDPVACLAVSPDGGALAAGHDNATAAVHELGAGRILLSLAGHEGAITAAAFNPKGNLLATGSRDHNIKVWESGTGRLSHTLTGHTGRITSLVFIPGSDLVVSGSSDKTVKVWDPGPGKLVYSLHGNSDWIEVMAVARDGTWLASGGRDGLVSSWPISPDALHLPPAQLLDQAEREAGLKIKGIYLHPWDPATGAVFPAPFQQSF